MYTTNNKTETNPNDKLVNDVLAKHPELVHLKGVLSENIATLNDTLLQEQGLEATLDMLSQYNRIKLLIDKI